MLTQNWQRTQEHRHTYLHSIRAEALYARSSGRRKTSVQSCSNAGPALSMVTYIRPAPVWRLLVACADAVQRRVLCYLFKSDLSQFVQGK